MKLIRLFAVVVLLLLALQCTALARVVTDPVKYSQPPCQTWPSYDFSSELRLDVSGATKYQSIMADDWKCPDGRMITDIHWWGSYWSPYPGEGYGDYSDGRPNAASGGITSFNLAIYADVPVNDPNNPHGYSYPGTQLWNYSIQGIANETWAFDLKDGNGILKETVYRYDVILPEAKWFPQDKDVIYWLSVQAVLPDDQSRQWGWHETTEKLNDLSVMRKNASETWFIPCGGHDMAFELTTVPEPSSIFALLTGVTGIVGVAVRRRR